MTRLQIFDCHSSSDHLRITSRSALHKPNLAKLNHLFNLLPRANWKLKGQTTSFSIPPFLPLTLPKKRCVWFRLQSQSKRLLSPQLLIAVSDRGDFSTGLHVYKPRRKKIVGGIGFLALQFICIIA